MRHFNTLDDWNRYVMYGDIYDTRFLDLNGRPVERTPFSHPYNFDEYVIWKDIRGIDNSSAVYSDRLYQWDYEKYNKCCQEVFKDERQCFDYISSYKIEKFLSMYFGKKVRLTAIIKGCNQSSGYPYWVFFYEEN